MLQNGNVQKKRNSKTSRHRLVTYLHVTCMAYVHLNAYACIDRRIKMVRGVFRLRKKTNKLTV